VLCIRDDDLETCVGLFLSRIVKFIDYSIRNVVIAAVIRVLYSGKLTFFSWCSL